MTSSESDEKPVDAAATTQHTDTYDDKGMGSASTSTDAMDDGHGKEAGQDPSQYGYGMEAQDHVDIERVESHTHRSVLSRLSRTTSAPRTPVAPTVLPLMDLDKGIVGWESQDDPAMPLNWAQSRKWSVTVMLACITFMTPFASSILAPAIQFLAEDYNVSSLTKASMPVSIFLLGYAVGPLFLSPLCEIYGRHVVLTSASAYFCVWLIGCALAPSIDTLIFFRFMCGVGGSACQTIGGAVIADVFPVHQRGRAMTIWMMGPMVGPTVGPVIGGFAAQTIGWRWGSWITFIPATIVVVVMAIFNSETNHQVLIKRKTLKLRKELGRPELRSCYVNPDAPVVTNGRILLNGLVRPIKMLFTSVIIFAVSLYIAFVYGCLYLLFNTIPMVFQGAYGWSIGVTSLVYFSLLIGYAISLSIFSVLSDKTVVRMTAANNGVYQPEFRLRDCIWFALILPVTFFWYGWGAAEKTHWIVPTLGIIPFGLGSIGVWMPIQAYIVDAYPQFAASGLAAFSVLRCTVAAFLPLAGPAMYEELGVAWGSSLLGFIAVAMIPIPTVIFKYGKTLRERYPLDL